MEFQGRISVSGKLWLKFAMGAYASEFQGRISSAYAAGAGGQVDEGVWKLTVHVNRALEAWETRMCPDARQAEGVAQGGRRSRVVSQTRV